MSIDQVDELGPDRLAYERRLRAIEFQLIGARQQADDDERLAFWWGLVIGCWFAIFLTHYRIAFTRRDAVPADDLETSP